MLKIVALYFCLTIFLVSGNGNSTKVVSPTAAPPSAGAQSQKAEPNSPQTVEPTPSEPNATTPDALTTTTTKPTTTTTTKPTTTTTTTTQKPTTTPPTTTTPASSTTTSPPPTPAPAPTTGEWSVTVGNTICAVVKMAVQFNVSYVTVDNKTMWQELTLPANKNETKASGTCNTKEQILNITWHNETDSLVIHFVKNDTTSKYSIHHIEVSLATHEFPNIKPNTTVQFNHSVDTFPTKLSSSYRCMRLQNLELTENGVNGTAGWLQVSNLQFQAFKTDNTTKFGDAQDCSAEVADVVPIVVGCALTGLVIIVLAAYLVGRRRSQARGYLSM